MEEILEDDFESPYCKACGSCGFDPCCPPTMCTFEKDKGCEYGKGYLDDLRFGWAMYQDLSEMIYNKCEKCNQEYDDFFMDAYKEIYDKNYNIFYKEMIEQQKLAKNK